MLRPHRRAATAILLALAIALSACGSSDSDTESGDTTSTTDDSDGSGDTGDPSEPSDDASQAADGGNTAAEGTGTVTVDGVEYPNFVGDCSISRGLDPETYEPIPVGDLSDPGLIVVVGIDNVVSEPEVEANFIIVSYPNFRMAGVGGAGTIDTIAYVDAGSAPDSGELALVSFSGTTDDGASVVAEVVCEVGLG